MVRFAESSGALDNGHFGSTGDLHDSSSSPVYNVTYVTQTTDSSGTVQSSYTAGYLGAFVLGAATGAIIANGSGYWWPPYCSGAYYYPYAVLYGGVTTGLLRRLLCNASL